MANVEKLDAGPKGVVVQFRQPAVPEPAALVGYIAKQGTLAKIRPDHSVFLARDYPTPEKRLTGAAQVMTQLAGLAKRRDNLFEEGTEMPAENASVIVYGASYSVYVRIVRIALHEKGVDYELVPVDVLADGGAPQDHLARQPFGRIPAFRA